MKIVLIEDDIYLNTLICDVLVTQGYEVDAFADGAKALKAIEQQYDLYIVDLSLPNVGGLEISKKIKEFSGSSPIIVISAEDSIDTILKAYDLGCQDYIKKPFHVKELLAKISVILKNQPSSQIKLSPNCVYDVKAKTLMLNGLVVPLTQKETMMLHLLAINMGMTVTNEEAEKFIWGEHMGNGYVRQLISKLRKKVGCATILNHSGNGYRLENND
ncbi:MAG: response regulator transcription factor [Arcobacteraceae bacterium]|nr:response regulator transcription factor [Arcobacteraceae bacterium]